MELTHLKSIGKNLCIMREYRGLTVAALAELSGVERANIVRIENGNRNPTINTLYKLSNALNCAIDIQFMPYKDQS